MKGIVDRFEGNLAILELENKNFISIPKSKLPLDAKEGSVVTINLDKIQVDLNETSKAKEDIEDLMDELFKK